MKTSYQNLTNADLLQELKTKVAESTQPNAAHFGDDPYGVKAVLGEVFNRVVATNGLHRVGSPFAKIATTMAEMTPSQTEDAKYVAEKLSSTFTDNVWAAALKGNTVQGQTYPKPRSIRQL